MPILRSRALCALLAAAAFCASTAKADTPVTYTDSGKALFSFSAPDFWTVHVGGQRPLTDPETNETRVVSRVIGLKPETDPRVWVGFVSPLGVRDFSDVKTYLTDIGPFLVKDAVIQSQKSRRIAGRAARTISGNGTRNGRSVNFTAVAIDLPNDRMAVSVVVMESGLDPASVTEANRIFETFRVGR